MKNVQAVSQNSPRDMTTMNRDLNDPQDPERSANHVTLMTCKCQCS